MGLISTNKWEAQHEKIFTYICMMVTVILLTACSSHLAIYADVEHIISDLETVVDHTLIETTENYDDTFPNEPETEDEPEQEVQNNNETNLPQKITPSSDILPNARQAAEDFLSTLTTIFVTPGAVETTWDGERHTATERYIVAWDEYNTSPVTTYERPEISFMPRETGGWYFFDNQGPADIQRTMVT